jgi:phosphotransferase system  glucose/maltose/N-acetylglucosamine-specific IIC component
MALDATAAVGSALSDGVTQALGVIGTNMPLVFGVGIAFVAWNVGKRVLGKI